MKKSSISQEKNVSFVVKNLIAALIIAIVALFVLMAWLKNYTQHGIEVDVPNITGMYLEEARVTVEHEGLHLEVIDSTYSKKVPLGTIVEQNPVAASHAKKDRTVYVIINANSVRQVPLPDLHDISYRQAEATLKSLGISVKDYAYEPSEYKDLVLDVRIDERTIEPGERLDEGSEVTLVVGRGKGTEKITVPNLCGMKLNDARSLLLSKSLTLGIYEYDVEPTETTADLYVVYKQEPTFGTIIVEGSRVDLYLSTDIEKAASQIEESDEEEFF
jgi:beta-lactam-binding protein with PASTA domain